MKYDALLYLPTLPTTKMKKGAVIYGQGLDVAEKRLYLVDKGSVRIESQHPSGKVTVEAEVGENGLFGVNEERPSRRYRQTAIAQESPTSIMSWSWAEVRQIIAGTDEKPAQPDLELGLFELRAVQASELRIRLDEFNYKISCRLAGTLIRRARKELAANRGTEPEGRRGWIEIPAVTHEVLAGYVLTSREIITHYMNQFRRQGFINYTRKGAEVWVDELERWMREEIGEPLVQAAAK